MKNSTIIVLSVLGFFVLVTGAFFLRITLYPAAQAVRIYEKTADADNVIYNYEYFKQQYQDIQSFQRKIVTAKEELSSFKNLTPRENWDFQDKQEYSRLTANLTGLKNMLNDMVGQYNARANMVNRKIFMGTNVPVTLNVEE